MPRPEPTYGFYVSDHGGEATQEEFSRALPEALARMRLVVPADDVPESLASAYMHAACALVDRVCGIDRRGSVTSETVGSTSVTYADASSGAGFTDADAARPWLQGTGLMWRGLS